MGLYRLRAEEQLCGGFRVGLAVDDEPRNLMLAIGQRLDCRRRRGCPDDGLLEAGLLDLYLQCCQHTDEPGRERSRTQLADHLAFIAMFTSPEPGSWLADFVTTAPTDLREAWANRVANRLSDLNDDESSQRWTRWIREYWTGRVESLPLPLTVEEASTMARRVLGLPIERMDAVDLVKRSDARFVEHDSLLHRLTEEDLAADSVTWTDFITHVLHGTPSRTGRSSTTSPRSWRSSSREPAA